MKKRITPILALVLALLMFVSATPAQVMAASSLEDAMAEVDVYARNKDLNWLTMNGDVKVQWYTYYNFHSEQTGETKEIPAYCVDPRLYGVPSKVSEGTGIKYGAQDTVSDPKITGIISNGYPHMDLNSLQKNAKQHILLNICVLFSGSLITHMSGAAMCRSTPPPKN
ncbi:MAG: thioester domain-containing protein [Pyramidobacter sp.]|nr:thioester domain-containing protein [Pyramidobacter sp.]